jgi:hypothetical protein
MSSLFNYIFKKLWCNSSDDALPEKTEEVVPEKTEEVVPEKTEEVVPEKTEEVVPEKTEEVVPEKTEEVVPEKTEEVVTEKTEEVVTEKTEEVVTEKTEESGILITTEDAAILDDDSDVNIKPQTDEALLNLFYNYHTNLDLIELLLKASEQSMLYTLKIIAHILKTKCDGTSNFYRKTCDWLFENHENQLIINMQNLLEISKTSNWDGLTHLPANSKSFKHYIKILSNNLKTNSDNINNWIQHDKHILSCVAKELGINVKTLKKDYLKPLTKNLLPKDDIDRESHVSDKSEIIVDFNLSHHEIMLSALSDQCYDDIKCVEQSLGV